MHSHPDKIIPMQTGERSPLVKASPTVGANAIANATDSHCKESHSSTSHPLSLPTPIVRRRRGVCATAWIGAVEAFVIYPINWVFRLAEGPGCPRGSLLRMSTVHPPPPPPSPTCASKQACVAGDQAELNHKEDGSTVSGDASTRHGE